MPHDDPLRPHRQGPSAASSCTTTLFAAPVNEAVLHQAVTAQLAGAPHRARTTPRPAARSAAAARSRTARRAPAAPARARAPRRTTAAAASCSGPHPRSYEQRLPRKMRRLALRGALTAKLGDEAIRVVDSFGLDAIKTQGRRRRPRRARRRPAACSSSRPSRDETPRACRRATCRPVEVILADSLNVVDVLNADTLLIEQPALARMEEVYA